MTKAEIINRIAEKYEQELDLFNELLGALKKQGVKYKPESLEYGPDCSGEYKLFVDCYDGSNLTISKSKSYCHIAYWDEYSNLIKSEDVKP